MSHFTTIKTQMVDKAALMQALRDLGHQPVQGPVEVRGYEGGRTFADLKIPTSNPEYDIGFRKVKGVYECVADWFGLKHIDQTQFLDQIAQRYAYHVARAKLEEQGFGLVSEEVDKNGRIHLVLRRMV